MSTNVETKEFQAEVRQLLDIVIHSLYTDREIFVRELVSNAADALEKLRHTQLTEREVFDDHLSLEIHISTDDTAKTITFTDYGIGMTRDELIENLGTIAHSGTRKFMKSVQESDNKEASLIGQFGVGFYSAFMVAREVKVYTHSWRPDAEHLVWISDGQSGYTIETTEGQRRGCRVVVKLKDDYKEFSSKERIKGVIESYSSFVPFPILLNGERINTVEALWRKNKSEISAEQYTEFYKFAARAFDEPRYHMHFSADAPLEINALLFVPGENTELWGMGQMEPGVALYCKNVLIDDKPEGLLPEWLRFLRGVIDSTDLPLNISRESMQDSAMVKKLNRVVTKRFIKFLNGEATSDPEKYRDFYKKFSRFLKEGAATDVEHRENVARLLRFESSMTEAGETTGFEDYLTRAKEGQDSIYYLIGESRKSLESGPYLEAFKARGLEVIYFDEPIDDYVLRNLQTFGEKKLVSADQADIELGDEVTPSEDRGEPLDESDLKALCEYMEAELGEKVEKVEGGRRLVGSPVAALNSDTYMSAHMRNMMRALNPDEEPPPVKVRLEINPRHELIKKLSGMRESNHELAKLVVAHLFDNALLAAGLLEEKTGLIARGYDLMTAALESERS